jgi:hypothetical protein
MKSSTSFWKKYRAQRVFLSLLALSALAISGCATSSKFVAGPPAPMLVDGDKNPPVIWVVREIEVSEQRKGTRGSKSTSHFGLFACYRRPLADPGAPTCYLAKTVGSVEELAWPGQVFYKDGVLNQVSQ